MTDSWRCHEDMRRVEWTIRICTACTLNNLFFHQSNLLVANLPFLEQDVHFHAINDRQLNFHQPLAASLSLKCLRWILPDQIVTIDNPVNLVERAGATMAKALAKR